MGQIQSIELQRNAGSITYYLPSGEERFKEKAWRVMLSLNAPWVRQALSLDFARLTASFEKRGYKADRFFPQPGFRSFSKWRDVIYVFHERQGGLVSCIVQLAKDPSPELEIQLKAGKVTYHETNTDIKEQQDFLIERIEEYVLVVNSLS